jgi:hypothetical protein
MKLRLACLSLGFLSLVLSLAAQTANSNSASAQVPPLIQFSNIATDEGGNTMSGPVTLTFSLYTSQQGGEPLWTETQNNVPLDSTGHYSVELGITKPNGVPTALFTTGEARWLGVRIAEQPEQPRVLLLSVPYALKAGDAATIGGLPPSAFVLAGPQTTTASAYITQPAAEQNAPPPTATDVTTTGGTVGYLPVWDATSDITNSVISQQIAGSDTTVKIGPGPSRATTTVDIDASLLDIAGTVEAEQLELLPLSAATASAGSDSHPFYLEASSYNNSTDKAVTQSFVLQAEPSGNNTASPSGTLNLLSGSGTTKPSETGLTFASNGIINFVTNQTFPNTISAVAGAPPISASTGAGMSTVSLSPCATANQVLQWNGTVWACATISGTGTITGVTAGTDLTGGGTSGNVTLNLNTANIPQLNANNIFNGNQTISGSLSAGSFLIGSGLFAFGTTGSVNNVFLGFAGSSTSGGVDNTAIGSSALAANNGTTGGALNTAAGYNALTQNTTGYSNTAVGAQALESNLTGAGNTAVGSAALGLSTGNYNTSIGYATIQSGNSGNYNTALGAEAGPSSLTGVNALSGMTAIGANAKVSQSNSLVLGATAQGSPGNTWVSVGIGTDTPRSILEAAELKSNAVGPVVTLTNPFSPEASGNLSAAALDFNTYLPATPPAGALYNASARIEAQDAGNFSDNLLFLSNLPGGANNGLHLNMTILSTGQVGIDTLEPTATLEVNGTAKFDGLVTFAPGQTFGGGGGSGTVTSVGLTAPATDFVVTGSPVTTSGTLGLGWIVAPDFNDTPGAIVKRDSSGNFTAGAITGASFQISNGTSSNLFASGSYANSNAFLGFAGNTTMTGTSNTASGYQALLANTTGGYNTANGAGALGLNCGTGVCTTASQGSGNTAVGYFALDANTTGYFNTALGYIARPLTNALVNSTAIGAFAMVKNNNAMVLGSIKGTNGCSAAIGCGDTFVGIGTTQPTNLLTLVGDITTSNGSPIADIPLSITSPSTDGTWIQLANTSTGGATWEIISAGPGDGEGAGNLVFTRLGGGTVYVDGNFNVTGTNVGIGTTTPQYTLDVNGTGNFSGAVNFASGQTFPGVPSLGAANIFTAQQTINGAAVGLSANASNATSTGVFGFGGSLGVWGDTNSTAANAAGVYGTSNGASGTTFGVYGSNASPAGVGVYGVGVTPSVTGSSYAGEYAFGVWGDAGGSSDYSTGVLGSADQGAGVVAVNNSSDVATLAVGNGNSNPLFLFTAISPAGNCNISGSGDLKCTGSKSAVVPVDEGKRKVALYAVEAPENWFEDFGSGQLSNGAVTIVLDSVYAQTVNTDMEYHVFLTPRGDCEGLYVGAAIAGGFEVRELHHGTSNIKFDYRIVARRKGYEKIRLADQTAEFDRTGAMMKHGLAQRSEGQRSVRPPALSVRAAAQPITAQPK